MPIYLYSSVYTICIYRTLQITSLKLNLLNPNLNILPKGIKQTIYACGEVVEKGCTCYNMKRRDYLGFGNGMAMRPKINFQHL